MLRTAFNGLALSLFMTAAALLPLRDSAAQQGPGGIITGADVDAISQILINSGAEVMREAIGDVDGLLVEDDGLVFRVLFFQCEEGPCRIMHLRTRFTDATITDEQTHEWNNSSTFSRASRNAEGHPELRMDMLFSEGVPGVYFAEFMGYWYAMVPLYAEFIQTGDNPFVQ